MAGDFDNINSHHYISQFNTIHKIAELHKPPPSDLETLDNHFFWGPTGSGKSYKARNDYPDAYIKDASTKWWCGYKDQENVIIDDFDERNKDLVRSLKIAADKYPFIAEIKGGSLNIRPKRIIVTSNYSPQEIWTKHQDLEPILRRFKVTRFESLLAPKHILAREDENVHAAYVQGFVPPPHIPNPLMRTFSMTSMSFLNEEEQQLQNRINFL